MLYQVAIGSMIGAFREYSRCVAENTKMRNCPAYEITPVYLTHVQFCVPLLWYGTLALALSVCRHHSIHKKLIISSC